MPVCFCLRNTCALALIPASLAWFQITFECESAKEEWPWMEGPGWPIYVLCLSVSGAQATRGGKSWHRFWNMQLFWVFKLESNHKKHGYYLSCRAYSASMFIHRKRKWPSANKRVNITSRMTLASVLTNQILDLCLFLGHLVAVLRKSHLFYNLTNEPISAWRKKTALTDVRTRLFLLLNYQQDRRTVAPLGDIYIYSV